MKDLPDLKLDLARFLQQTFASDDVWNKAQLQYLQAAAFLADRQRLQPIARRYRKNPIRFCERELGANWFETVVLTTHKYQVQALSEILSTATKFLGSPELPTDADAKQMISYWRRLAARAPGRKLSEEFPRAYELRKQGKTFHQICLLLIPAYAQMSPTKRRNERERMRSGVTRLEQKAAKKPQGVTK